MYFFSFNNISFRVDIFMHLITTTVLLIISSTFCFGQKFENAIKLLNDKLDYKLQDSIKQTPSLEEQLSKRFKTCSKYQSELSNLNLNEIISSKHSYLKQQNHDDNYTYSSFQFIEVKFSSIKSANEFKLILDQLGNRTDCISKGGILWWTNGMYMYFIVSHAYFMTYKYPELKSVIDKAID